MSPVQGAHNLRQRAEQLAATLPPLLVAAERVAATVVQGVHGRRRVGQGETFWQFRHYEVGDPPQIIDWRQSAKTDHIFTRQMEWEAAQSAWIWRDTSPSMDWRSQDSLPTKRQRADLLSLALAALLVRGGERVSLLGSSLKPAAGRGALTRLANAIALDGAGDRAEPRANAASRRPANDPADRRGGEDGGEDPAGPAPHPLDLPPVLPLPRHGQLVLIGDFLAPLEAIDAVVGEYAERGLKGHILQLLDPAEVALPFRGRVRFEGLEDERSWLLSRVEPVRTDYRARLQAQEEGLKDLARNVGWSFSLECTDRPPQNALLALYAALSEPRRR
ncbi:MAG: DUF58 domain-containing protein [Kiloniellales bacterium]|nr:DUF58 domain-containing protein [Kiloniellales bacterium]